MKKKIYVYSFYRFKILKKTNQIKDKLEKLSTNKIIYGTILVAEEGINGSISGTQNDLNRFIIDLKKLLRIRKLIVKISRNQYIPFYRLKIKLKKEIITIGDKSIKPETLSGKQVLPRNWDKIINNKNYFIIDTRNYYEVSIGTFKNSNNPKTKSFKGFPNYIRKQNLNKNQPIALFCTGGIRCEKASSYMLKNGFKNVCQLDGGILNYLEFKKNKRDSSWAGECFVFDDRVSLNNKLSKGSYDQCYGCRHPISNDDKRLKSYVKGVSCKYCIMDKPIKKIRSSTMRQNQIDKNEILNLNHPFKRINETDL